MWVEGFIYALKSGLILFILYGVYLLLFRKNTRYGLKRGILLGIMLAALALPFIKLEINHEALPHSPVISKVNELVRVPETVIIQPESEPFAFSYSLSRSPR